MTSSSEIESRFPVELVDSGSFAISSRRKAILSALLGTCVGLALFDRKAGVGGLYHILLPQPTGLAEAWQPDNYAATGAPRFIQALLNACANPENLEAVIAGGALVGPISLEDLQLDIGGRTVDIVLEILHRQKITIKNTETGGYFSCRINLNLNNWEYSVHPLGDYSPLKSDTLQHISQNDLDEAIRKVRPIPQIALKIMRLMSDDDYSLKAVAREIRHDQVISAKVLNVCNSVSYSPVKKIDSIDQAVFMLGENLIFQLVISASLDDFLNSSDKGYSLCKGGLFKHSLGAAIVAEKLAKLTGKVSPEVAYTAGLLHDIGKVVLDQSLDQILPAFYRRLYTEGANLVNVEEEMLGISHSEVGGKLADIWLLPNSLKEAIKFHHQPEKADKYPQLTCIVNLADLLVSKFQAGKTIERNSTEKLEQRMEFLGLNLRRFTEVVDFIPWRSLEERMMF